MKNIFICMVFAAVAICVTNAWAALSQTVNVNANVATITGSLAITVNKVTGAIWTPTTEISFGTLVWDPVDKIFMPANYYVVDVRVTDNTETAWTVTHTRASLAGQGANIDDKVNVSFLKQTSSIAGTELQKVSFANSQNVAYTKAALAGGWLRIRYSISTGDPADASGVTPIGLETPSGTYTGSVTITLTP